MKKILAFLAIAANAVLYTASAQTDECEQKFEAYELNIKSRLYDNAESQLENLVKQCAKYSPEIYTYGEELYLYRIESARTKDGKSENITALLQLFDDYEKNFPGNGSVVRKAMLLKKYDLAKDDEVYKMLDGFYKTHKDKFVDYDALQTYFMLYLEKYESGKGTITIQDFIEKYAGIAAQVSYAKTKLLEEKAILLQKQQSEILTDKEKQTVEKADRVADALDAVADNIKILASKYFSCTALSEYYSKDFDKNKENVAWLQAAATVLYDNKCYDSGVLYKIASAAYKLKQGAEQAYMMGMLEVKNGKIEESIPHFEKSAAMQADERVKADEYYHLATLLKNTDKTRAKQYALKAAETNKNFGKPYILLANMYSSVIKNECNLNDFERKALLFLAIETLNKAEVAEPKYKATVTALKEEYSQNLPSKDEAKAAGYKKGKEIKYGCWINETVKLPKL
ncbi:hypothetical protein GCM10007424_07860 [Flavobacterium suaedae]|uniref:Tetratricopeptide repeat protein n=1 Tax=Flavobacterium suaedae TaxID=1767027 RepID=A0ABQ1JNL5_9FLAO|nr:hypothetical protein [Flavobacterium suaedae]GGB70346.1 hypothetical protein GCM10007424_07860 [Flavobacterium suaedae]